MGNKIMSPDQILAFSRGEDAAAADKTADPEKCVGMNGLIKKKALTKQAKIHNHENLMAWHEGFAAGSMSLEGGITPKQFSETMKAAFDADEKCSSVWIQFAGECVKGQQYVDFQSTGDTQTEVNRWLGTLLAKLFQIDRTFGADAARRVCRMSEIPQCLYPWEMDRAAQCFASGGTVADISEMIESGEIVEDESPFPHLGDDFRSDGDQTIVMA